MRKRDGTGKNPPDDGDGGTEAPTKDERDQDRCCDREYESDERGNKEDVARDGAGELRRAGGFGARGTREERDSSGLRDLPERLGDDNTQGVNADVRGAEEEVHDKDVEAVGEERREVAELTAHSEA
jgi:hypothetical protein